MCVGADKRDSLVVLTRTLPHSPPLHVAMPNTSKCVDTGLFISQYINSMNRVARSCDMAPVSHLLPSSLQNAL